ncbi:SpoIIE family protein phosphatase [Actinomadura sp. ATCC 31491]|uniref:SpoIIE family protein phosphatase n=1 Tax=Actinomadura luzonensis TaxID=2805427 RepID=A0ABT0FUC0_9ACTN|nr:SpoIIE family protein phosphatase [Actinomadura luzonensis]MCK2215936.1 SpoIIE family protein phosphatase [Actinomadura luzonensis]
MDPLEGYRSRLADLDASIARARAHPEVVLARASGLLAGRAGCRVGEAHAYLVRLAAERGRPAHEVAAELLTALERLPPGGESALADTVAAALPLQPGRARRPTPPLPGPTPARQAWIEAVRQVLAVLPDRYILLLPQYDTAGQVADYVFAAVSPSVVDLSGRSGPELLGRRMSEVYPEVVGGPIWDAWRRTLRDGLPREVGPVPYVSPAERAPAEIPLTVKVWPVGGGLLQSWVRHDEETRLAERIAHTERLGNLGWAEWDLITGQSAWSEGLYQIYERDPSQGPLPREETEALVLPDDLPVRRQAAEAFGRGEAVDVTFRIQVGGRVKHVRTIVDAVRDSAGVPVKVYGIVQDVTGPETSRRRLSEVEEQLRQHQRSLAAEHELAGRLQQIVLPVPREPIDLPGLRVAIRYLPAEQASRVGGDWYHAAPTGDGGVLLAVGDVAGHGIESAAAMAQLRHALAALAATTTDDPGRLLLALNRLLLAGEVTRPPRSQVPVTATAVIARYEPATGRLVWARAGHPPPLLARAGVTAELDGPGGPLLGAFPAADYPTGVTHLRLGDVLLLYTDGLVEHRGRHLDEGLASVLAVLDRITAEPSPRPLADLLGQLRDANPDDDTCVLAARPLGPGEAR